MSKGQCASRIQVWAPAKLNLYLEILSRRPDGFHELDTVMTAISLYDTLSVRPNPGSPQIAFSIRTSLGNSQSAESASVETVPADHTNLIVRAAQLLQSRSGTDQGAAIHLIKRIPVAAGLGGASSDAAATLVACNELWKLGWQRERLAELAAQLGSDVPFFIYGGTATCRGRGEIIHPMPARPCQHFVVAKPPVGLSTADVYGACEVPRKPQQRDIAELKHFVARNRLQHAAQRLTPWIGQLAAAFSHSGARYHGMSGSGTSYFAICANAAAAFRLRRRLISRKIGRVFYAHGDCRIRSRLREPNLN